MSILAIAQATQAANKPNTAMGITQAQFEIFAAWLDEQGYQPGDKTTYGTNEIVRASKVIFVAGTRRNVVVHIYAKGTGFNVYVNNYCTEELLKESGAL